MVFHVRMHKTKGEDTEKRRRRKTQHRFTINYSGSSIVIISMRLADKKSERHDTQINKNKGK